MADVDSSLEAHWITDGVDHAEDSAEVSALMDARCDTAQVSDALLAGNPGSCGIGIVDHWMGTGLTVLPPDLTELTPGLDQGTISAIEEGAVAVRRDWDSSLGADLEAAGVTSLQVVSLVDSGNDELSLSSEGAGTDADPDSGSTIPVVYLGEPGDSSAEWYTWPPAKAELPWQGAALLSADTAERIGWDSPASTVVVSSPDGEVSEDQVQAINQALIDGSPGIVGPTLTLETGGSADRTLHTTDHRAAADLRRPGCARHPGRDSAVCLRVTGRLGDAVCDRCRFRLPPGLGRDPCSFAGAAGWRAGARRWARARHGSWGFERSGPRPTVWGIHLVLRLDSVATVRDGRHRDRCRGGTGLGHGAAGADADQPPGRLTSTTRGHDRPNVGETPPRIG